MLEQDLVENWWFVLMKKWISWIGFVISIKWTKNFSLKWGRKKREIRSVSWSV